MEKLTGTTSKEMTVEDANKLAEIYNRWLKARSNVLAGTANSVEKAIFDNTPTVAGRPLWVSQLTSEESRLFNEAYKSLSESK